MTDTHKKKQARRIERTRTHLEEKQKKAAESLTQRRRNPTYTYTSLSVNDRPLYTRNGIIALLSSVRAVAEKLRSGFLYHSVNWLIITFVPVATSLLVCKSKQEASDN